MKTRMRNVMLVIMLVMFMVVGTGYADLSDGLVAYYPFTGNANDESGNGHHGDVRGDTILTEDMIGETGKAYYFDGDRDYIYLGTDSAFAPEEFSVCAWFKTSSSGGWQSIYGLSYGAGPRREFNLRVWYWAVYGYYDVLALKISDKFLNGTTNVVDGQWHHVVATRAGSVARLFLDGELEAESESMPDPVSGRSPALPYYIGAVYETGDHAPANYEFQGSIDEVRLYNRALSSDEISELSNSPPVAVCQDVLVAVGTDGYVDASVNGGSYDPDGDEIIYSQDPAGPYPAGVYNVELNVTDPYEASDSCQAMLIVYDPSGGFVTGGGWIWSPKGAYVADPWLEGKANFGFVSKYKKGASEPTGQTEFVFQAGDLNFHSSSYDWLVVNQNGSNAQFKGSGTINGQGDYKFMLWAGDDNPDTFRIKIWEENGGEVVIYDNGFDQSIGGGSIVIHTK